MSEKPKYLDHAGVDQAHCLADGLFVPSLKKVNGTLPKLDIRYSFGKKYVLWWRNYEALDVADLCVFLALHRIANEYIRRQVIGKDIKSEIGQEVRAGLQLGSHAAAQDCIMISTTLTEIAKIVGVQDGQKTLDDIMDSLVRMSSTMLALHDAEDISKNYWQAQLINFKRVKNRRLVVGLNPRLAAALLNTSKTYIDMRELRQIKSKVAKRLYVWLSAWANANRASSIHLDRFIQHVWETESQHLDSQTLRNRRRALRIAIADISALDGWTCSIDEATRLVRVIKPEFTK